MYFNVCYIVFIECRFFLKLKKPKKHLLKPSYFGHEKTETFKFSVLFLRKKNNCDYDSWDRGRAF